MERERVLVTVCNFYLSELGGLYCEFFPFFFCWGTSSWFSVAVCLRGFHPQHL